MSCLTLLFHFYASGSMTVLKMQRVNYYLKPLKMKGGYFTLSIPVDLGF